MSDAKPEKRIDDHGRSRHSKSMSTGRKIAYVLLGPMIGGFVGFLGGLAWTELAGTSGFEGYSGFVVVYWLMAGVILGLIAGLFIAVRR
jgi:ABC-type antimicrobial peptide transport system permease subunit